ncbi:MAG: hypothetical protein A3G41_06470 [Elusimicrobia bacterium RIFCSPLOWO2_12_FULL_59_9]|nr:MAG: hypothetical protein A3G41_06470 [Elusimicrobia bacterium RIFCSPLOWO2_12_FULL_59_9]
MEKKQRIAAWLSSGAYAVSFALPANIVEFKGASVTVPGWQAAVMSFAVPDADFGSLPKRVSYVLLACPANVLMILGIFLLLRGRTRWTPWLLGYAVLGQLYWLTGVVLSTMKIGYWLWLVSGIFLFALSLAARKSSPHPSQA